MQRLDAPRAGSVRVMIAANDVPIRHLGVRGNENLATGKGLDPLQKLESVAYRGKVWMNLVAAGRTTAMASASGASRIAPAAWM